MTTMTTYTKTTRRGLKTLAVLLLASLLSLTSASAQGVFRLERDSLPFFRGLALSADLVGLAQMKLGDYGQYEGALRVNLNNQYFPILEVGYGKADHRDDVVTGITYRTKAPYFRLGGDVNLMKNKRSPNRIYAGLRYAFTSYKVDLDRQPFPDPVWQWDTSFGVVGESCYQHWAEIVFGIDAQVAGPVHLGWSVRYRRRVAHDDGITGKTWYVPGYGTQGSTKMWATFNFIIDI